MRVVIGFVGSENTDLVVRESGEDNELEMKTSFEHFNFKESSNCIIENG